MATAPTTRSSAIHQRRRGHRAGPEVEYQWLPTSHWAITGNLALAGREVRPLHVRRREHRRRAAVHQCAGVLRLNVEYRTQVGNSDLSARIGYSYQSSVIATTEIIRAEIPPNGRPPISQDGYGLLSAGIIWNINPA